MYMKGSESSEPVIGAGQTSHSTDNVGENDDPARHTASCVSNNSTDALRCTLAVDTPPTVHVHIVTDDIAATARCYSHSQDNGTDSFQTLHQQYNVPHHLLSLVHRIKNMSVTDLLHIGDFIETVAARDVYTLLPYTGSNWFIPSTRECTAAEKHWEVRYSWSSGGLIVALGGRRFAIRALSLLVRLGWIAMLGLALWLMLPRGLMQPGGCVWDPVVLIVVSALVGGLICRIVQVPPLAGVLWMSIVWNNVPRLGYFTAGVDRHVPMIASRLALTLVLLRAGYSMHLRTIWQHWKQSLLLSTMPFVCEGVLHSLVAWRVFEYHDGTNWPFLQGMLCSVVSPAVVVPGALYLQELGYSRTRGALPLMLSAAGVEVVLGVWCANFILSLVFDDHNHLAVSIILGVAQFVVGGLLGVSLGYGFHYVVEVLKSEAQRLPHGKYQSRHMNDTLYFAYAILLTIACTVVFLGYQVNLAGGGCVVTVFFALTVSHLWMNQSKDELVRQNKFIAHQLSVTWDQAMLPILFATMGTNIDIRAVFHMDFFYRAAICLACSTAVRVLVIYLVQFGLGMRVREKLLVCMGYLAKATVQASMGPIASNRVADLIARAHAHERGKYATMQRHAETVQNVSALYVMFMAAFASVAIARGGQLMLTRDQEQETATRSDATGTPRQEKDDLLQAPATLKEL